MIRLHNDNLGRLLHPVLYHRIHAFCMQYTPEIPAELFTNAILQRLYNSDSSLHILVTLDDNYTVIEHAIIDVQHAYGIPVIHCFQLVKDKPNINTMDELMEYVDKLKAETNAACITFTTTKNTKAYQKRYGYSLLRSVMLKTSATTDNSNSED